MNNNESQSTNYERRITRSLKITLDDKNLADSSNIDKYYSKKKNKNINTKNINDTNSPTKIKIPMPFLITEIIHSQNGSVSDKEKLNSKKEEELKKQCGDQHSPIDSIEEFGKIQNVTIEAEKGNEQILELTEEEKNKTTLGNLENSAHEPIKISEEILNMKKSSIKVFSVENMRNNSTDPNENQNLAKPPKKKSKRYTELLENSLLIFDRPPKKEKPVKVKNQKGKTGDAFLEKQNPAKCDQQIQNSLCLMAEFNEDTNTTSKDLKIKNSKLESVIIPPFNSNELLKVYNDIKDHKNLGRKRSNPISYSINKKKEEKECTIMTDNLVNLPEITKINSNIDSYLNLDCISQKVLKSNFMNTQYEKLLKEKLYILNENTEMGVEIKNEVPNTIPNPFDDKLRLEYAKTLNFIKVFQEDYAPIQMQKENEKIDQMMKIESSNQTQIKNNVSSSKTHFIKKKQSAVNIKRECGVSYVVESESKQLNVNDKYDRLGHLVYQGTHSIDQLEEENSHMFISQLLVKELINKPLIITIFESPDEEEMKMYLLYPEKRLNIAKEVFLLESLDEIWKFAKDKYFLAINLIYDNKVGIRNFTNDEIVNLSIRDLLSISDIQIGFLFRKATSGIKSVLKLYKNSGVDKIQHPATFKLSNLNSDEDIDLSIEKLSGTNMSTLSMRIELYVPEKQWKNATMFAKQFLYTFMCQVEDKISKLILNWNEYRYLMYSLSKDNKVREYIDAIPYFTLNTNKDSINNLVNNTSYFLLNQIPLEKISEELTENKSDLLHSEFLNCGIIKINNSFAEKISLINGLIFNNLPLPMYIISTRDCFVFDLNVQVDNIIELNGRRYIKKKYFFDKNNVPSNYYKFKANEDDLSVGIVTYESYFTHEELTNIEKCVEKTEEFSLKDGFLPETAQKTMSGEKLKRTKFFFGSRYMWTKKQLSEPNAYVAAGIRKDVSPAPYWMKEKIEIPLVKAGIIQENFINSFALNVYHDGTEGLAQHFDDAVRFKQPIYTLRLFSDSRLSFGSQLYGFCNGAFTIPLPRGCICIMEENSYASNGVKHCIRPCDMTGKSSALILRQMHPNMIHQAEIYDLLVDFPSWLSSLSVKSNAVSYTQQKAIEAEYLIKVSELEKKANKSTQEKNNKIDDEIVTILNDVISTIEVQMSDNSKNDQKQNKRKKKTKEIILIS